jgi:hypothetical protein
LREDPPGSFRATLSIDGAPLHHTGKFAKPAEAVGALLDDGAVREIVKRLSDRIPV